MSYSKTKDSTTKKNIIIHTFQIIGADYAGSIYYHTKCKKKPSKANILLFTCCVNRVVHVELVETVNI